MGLLFLWHRILFPQTAGGIPFQDTFVKHVGGNYIDSLE